MDHAAKAYSEPRMSDAASCSNGQKGPKARPPILVHQPVLAHPVSHIAKRDDPFAFCADLTAQAANVDIDTSCEWIGV